MNSAKYVEGLIDDLNAQYSTGGIPLSDAMWQAGLACVGWPYVFGAWGALCTVSERKKRLSYNPSHTTIKTKCKAWDNGNCKGCQWFPDEERTRCFDCRGFEKWLYEQFGIFLEGQGATSQWNTKSNWCVQSDDMSAIPQGVLVSIFIKDGSSMSHTGFYLNGQTLECSNGVQHFNPMKKNRWTHWAVADVFRDELKEADDMAGGKAIVTGKKVALRKDPSKSAAIITRINTGETVELAEEPPKEWLYVEYKGKKGWMMREFLQE